MDIIAMSQDNMWKNPISCNVTLKKMAIYIYTVVSVKFGLVGFLLSLNFRIF